MSKNATRGRPQLIDRDRIVQAALAIGLDGLSMHAIARELGVSATCLYRYVDSREALLGLCMDEVLGRVVLPAEGDSWREFLAALSRSFRQALLSVPGASNYAYTMGAADGRAMHIIEQTLAKLLASGFAPHDAWRAYALIIDHVFVLTDRQERFIDKKTEEVNLLHPTVKGTLFPAFTSVMSEILPMDFDDVYEHQLSCLLDGIEATAPLS